MPQGAASPGRMFPGVQIQQNGPWIRSRCAAASSVEETEHSRIMENESSYSPSIRYLASEKALRPYDGGLIHTHKKEKGADDCRLNQKPRGLR